MVLKYPQKGKYDSYLCREATIDLEDLAEDYTVTYLDPAMQRLGGFENGSGWSSANTRSFLGSLLEATNGSEVLRLDIDEAIMYAERSGDQASLDYFRETAQRGYKYIVIDGNNTSSAVYNFLKDNVGAAEDPEKSTGKCKFFSEFSKEDQRKIKKIDIKVFQLSSISRPEMTKLFRRLNKSSELNPQERRQAVLTILSAFIREISNDADTSGDRRGGNVFWNTFYKEKKTDTRIHEQQVAKLALKINSSFTSATNPNDLDALHENHNDLKVGTKNRVKRIMQVAKRIAQSKAKAEQAS